MDRINSTVPFDLALRKRSRVRAKVGEEVEILRPGDSVYYDSSTPHLVKCEGKASAKILAVIYAGER